MVHLLIFFISKTNGTDLIYMCNINKKKLKNFKKKFFFSKKKKKKKRDG
jgi:hypothetical protein